VLFVIIQRYRKSYYAKIKISKYGIIKEYMDTKRPSNKNLRFQ